MSNLVSTYDRSEMATVREYFPDNLTSAYVAIRELNISSELSYRPEGSKGKGSRLYFHKDLQRVKDYLDQQQADAVTECPDGHMDMQMIEAKYGLKQHVISSLFAAMNLRPKGTYKRNKRPVNYFDKHDVAYVMALVEDGRVQFASQSTEPGSMYDIVREENAMDSLRHSEPGFADLMAEAYPEKYK